MLVIGIAGGTGSGKTTVVNQIVNDLPGDEVTVLSQDSYYKKNDGMPFEERCRINFDHPRAIDFDLLIKHLKELRNGNVIDQPIYSFARHNRIEDTIKTHPKKVIIVEGILIFTNKQLRDLMDIKLYIYADSDERLIRRLRRDISERGRDINEVLQRYQDTLKPMHEQFIEPSKNYADIIIPHDKYNTVAIDIVRTVINERLKN
jgi:uridine kinase